MHLLTVYCFFYHQNLHFFKNNKNLEPLFTSYCDFFFQKFFMLIFGIFYSRKKCFLEADFAGKKYFFLHNFLFFHPYESINFYSTGLLKIPLIIVTPLVLIKYANLFCTYLFILFYTFLYLSSVYLGKICILFLKKCRNCIL